MNKVNKGIMANADLAVLNESKRSRSGHRAGRIFPHRPAQTVLQAYYGITDSSVPRGNHHFSKSTDRRSLGKSINDASHVSARFQEIVSTEHASANKRSEVPSPGPQLLSSTGELFGVLR